VDWHRDGERRAEGLKDDALAGGDFPAFRRDLDVLSLGIGEVEMKAAAAGCGRDAAANEDVGTFPVGVNGACFEMFADGGEGLCGRDVAGESALGIEPVAKGDGVERQGVEAAFDAVNAHEGAAVGGGKGNGFLGDGLEFGG
jgi:hypothetical protein